MSTSLAPLAIFTYFAYVCTVCASSLDMLCVLVVIDGSYLVRLSDNRKGQQLDKGDLGASLYVALCFLHSNGSLNPFDKLIGPVEWVWRRGYWAKKCAGNECSKGKCV